MSKRPSPDSVICIDLTEDDDGREEKLNNVRKRLKGTPDEKAPSNVKIEGAARRTVFDVDDEDDNGGRNSGLGVLQQALKSEIQVVPPAALEIHAASAQASSSRGGAADNGIELVGTANETRLPHMRQHCPDNKFVQDVSYLQRQGHTQSLKEGMQDNSSFCDLCFCFVCDKPAKECTSWSFPGRSVSSCHCHASETGRDALMWKGQRSRAKIARDAGTVPPPPAPTVQTPPPTPGVIGVGPFEPDNALAANDPHLTKCRKCGWYNKYDHLNFAMMDQKSLIYPSANNGLHHVGFLDWCQSCGRVASENDFGKLQARPYVRKPGDVFLGEKTIPFSIIAHDPRQFEKFKNRWAEKEGSDTNWVYSEAELEQDVFYHRLGKYPMLRMILASIPILDTKKLPKTGSLCLPKRSMTPGGDNYYYGCQLERNAVSADETEAIIVEERNNRELFGALKSFKSIGCAKEDKSAILDGDIVANWNAADRSGTFKVRLFLQQGAFGSSVSWNDSQKRGLTNLLGLWFGIFPFTLRDLASVPARIPPAKFVRNKISIPRPPFVLSSSKQQRLHKKHIGHLEKKVKLNNKRLEKKQSELSLNPSAKGGLLGGTCSANTGLAGVLKSYCVEMFSEDVTRFMQKETCSMRNSAGAFSQWEMYLSRLRLRSGHRGMRKSGSPMLARKSEKMETSFEPYLRQKDHLLVGFLASKCMALRYQTNSLKGMLDHLENLHHASVPFIEGLNVELLEFQRQSVQWALERETTPGGVQSYLWAKLPEVADADQDIYYNPILERVRRDKPRLVRGGIIADEMGLGKTVISLALILENPAPAVPQSGSAITVLNDGAVGAPAATETETWDKDLYARTSDSNSKRGSIISRGTLVVCPVSLVGQWIEEAKSKLKDPGLVYPYHGQNRKRNAATLAQSAIVVTTYETLASDATYHAKKAGTDYCAPCEQVRWWRIICDESHALRDSSTKKSVSIMNLVADHKWLVSGTPTNTSLNDLRNQLKFVGLENVDQMFSIFSYTVFFHTDDRSKANSRLHSWDDLQSRSDPRRYGHFVFLMRCLMIRHSQRQTYRGTTTTLMSLPPKTERTMEIEFDEEENKEYAALDKAALDFYRKFKNDGHMLSKHYLLLTQKLIPLRIAASGGRVPIDDDGDKVEDLQDEDDGDSPKKIKGKKEQRFSEFAYTSKVNALIAELKRAREENPHSKSLVFSQFASTLKWLQQELPKHGFQYRTLSGDMSMKKRAKALHDFQHDPPTTIFLLSLRAGAVGINLTQANRVFLTEPSFNPAVEAQAIGRVHRLGQKRKVEVIRLVTKNSVETRIMEMLKKKYGNSEADKGATAHALVGSIQFDKAKVLSEEFDILYGLTKPLADSDGDVLMEEVTSARI